MNTSEVLGDIVKVLPLFCDDFLQVLRLELLDRITMPSCQRDSAVPGVLKALQGPTIKLVAPGATPGVSDTARAIAMERVTLLLNRCSCDDLELLADVIHDELLCPARPSTRRQLRLVGHRRAAAARRHLVQKRGDACN